MEIPFSYALRTTLRQGYSLKTFQHDIIAAMVVSLVALPLAMALAIAIGLPPQHGIYAAIVAGIITPLFGGSAMQVTGPTAAFVVIVAPIVTQYGLRGLIIAEILAGIVLLIVALARLGRLIAYIPYPVTTGFTAGIAVVLGTLAFNDFLGLGIEKLQGSYVEKLSTLIAHLNHTQWQEVLVGGVTLLLIILTGKKFPKLPAPIFGIAAGTLLGYALHRYGLDIATIGNRFHYETAMGMKAGIPPFPPEIHFFTNEPDKLFTWPSYQELRELLTPALVIAALGALESLLSATVADNVTGTKHNPNHELFGVGLGNIASGLVAGVPATGAIARTMTNINAGAKTPIAAILHGIFIMAYVLLLSPLISYVPMASLAALLLVTATRMSHYKQFFHTLRIASRSDVTVLLVCFSLTVFVDMVAGVAAGMILACFLFMQHISSLMETALTAGGQKDAPMDVALPEHVMIYHINGPLFFGTVERAFDRYSFIHDHITVLIMDMEHVPLIDISGLVALKKLITSVVKDGHTVILCGKKRVIKQVLEGMPEEAARSVKSTLRLEEAIALVPKE